MLDSRSFCSLRNGRQPRDGEGAQHGARGEGTGRVQPAPVGAPRTKAFPEPRQGRGARARASGCSSGFILEL